LYSKNVLVLNVDSTYHCLAYGHKYLLRCLHPKKYKMVLSLL
jgi:hypothetical protein